MGFYNPRRTKNLFDPKTKEPYRLSRSRVDTFLNCPKCFYFDRKLGVDRPPGFPFALNSAVDTLFKKEFDLFRKAGKPHPLMVSAGIDAIPFAHKELDTWRENFVGLQYHDKQSNFLVTGAIDDVWVNGKGELIVVDYKSTSKETEITLDADWQIGYKRQMEFYQWLFRQLGFPVSDTGYFVYANGRTDQPHFKNTLTFKTTLIPYKGNPAWIPDTLLAARACLEAPRPPASGKDCDYCAYVEAVKSILEATPQATALSPKRKKVAGQDTLL